MTQRVTETEIKRETDMDTDTTETTTELNKTITKWPREIQANEYKTPGVVFYLLSVQFVSQNQSII